MHERRDALVAGARFVIATNEVATSRQDCRATVGELSIRDAAANVVANEVVARVDVRARSDHGLDALVDALTTAGLAAGRQSRCRASVETVWRRRAVAMDSQVRGVLRPVAARATDGATAHDVETSSWAGHDAGILRAAGVQVGMLFVRSGRGGVSHSPHETVALSDVASGVAALAEALGQLAE
jgi:N-carbamoyl-L-amino-acid hydrolase